MERVRYPAEFKAETVEQVTERGHGVVSVPRPGSRLQPAPAAGGAKSTSFGHALAQQHWRVVTLGSNAHADGAEIERLQGCAVHVLKPLRQASASVWPPQRRPLGPLAMTIAMRGAWSGDAPPPAFSEELGRN